MAAEADRPMTGREFELFIEHREINNIFNWDSVKFSVIQNLRLLLMKIDFHKIIARNLIQKVQQR